MGTIRRQISTGIRTAAGFSFLELVVVIAIVATLIAVAASRLIPYVAEAERVAVMRLEGQLRNVLMMEAALYIARGDSASLGQLDFANPMALVLAPPGSYLGELNAPSHDSLPARSWHFDTSVRRLVYRASRSLDSAGSEPWIYQYSVTVAFVDRNGDARYSPGVDEFQGVRLRRLAQEKSQLPEVVANQVLATSVAMSRRTS